MSIHDLIETTFAEEAGLPAPVEDVQFLQRGVLDTYIVDAAGERFVAQIGREGTSPLLRLRRNLGVVSRLERGTQLPALLAWRQGGKPDREPWALIVTSYVPGEELRPSTLNQESWRSLCELLEAVHSLPSERQVGNRLVRPSDGPSAFCAVARELERLLPGVGLPVRAVDLGRHLSDINSFLDMNAPVFDHPTRFIHGDLSRANIRISGGVAGLVDWADAGAGDYAFDLGCLKFALDSVAPRSSPTLIQALARRYRRIFGDESLELRLAFYLAFPGLVQALSYSTAPATFNFARAMRVRACLSHSLAQWRSPLRLDGLRPGAPAAATDHSWFRVSMGIHRAGSLLR